MNSRDQIIRDEEITVLSRLSSKIVYSILQSHQFNPHISRVLLQVLKDFIKQKNIDFLHDNEKVIDSAPFVINSILGKIQNYDPSEIELEKWIEKFLFKTRDISELKLTQQIILPNIGIIFEILEVISKRYEFLSLYFPTIAKLKKEEILEILQEKIIELNLKDRKIIYKWVDKNLKNFLSVKIDLLDHGLPLINLSFIKLFLRKIINNLDEKQSFNIFTKIAICHFKNFQDEDIISLVFQELGGFYIKISQMSAEMLPKKFKHKLEFFQNNTGGLYISSLKSQEYLQNILASEELQSIRNHFDVETHSPSYFAGASIGAIYEVHVKKSFQNLYQNQTTVLFKIKRPGIKKNLQKQVNHFFKMIYELEAEIEDDLTKIKLNGFKANGKSLAKQIMKELCFESELKNGNLISSIVEINEKIVIPKYYFAKKNLIVMEKLKGVKINRSEYLSNQTKKNIANSTSIFFIKLIFKERIIWPDPHPGNLLFIEEKNSIGIIDLNPIYQWEARDIHHFILLIMNLLIKDTDKVIFYLKKLNNSNQEGINKIIISQHFNRFKDKAPKDFILSFFKLLINEGISLKTEVTLVIKSILQLSFSLNSFSNDFDFYTILKNVLIKDHRHYFLRHIGFSKVFYYILSYSLKTLIEKNKLDFGPLMDEGDLNCFNDIFKNLEERNICEIKINRISPDGSLLFYPSLKDGNSKISAILRIHPTSNTLLYQYEILIPEKQWLKENNSYLYFISFCYFISMIEFLEKMKRFSSDQYLLVMSSLIKSEKFLTPHDKKIIIETKIQSTKTLLKKVKLLFKKSHLILKCVLFFQLKSLHFERIILKREPSIFLSFLKFQHLILNFFIYFFKKYYNGYFPQDLFIPVNSQELIKSSLGILNREN